MTKRVRSVEVRGWEIPPNKLTIRDKAVIETQIGAPIEILYSAKRRKFTAFTRCIDAQATMAPLMAVVGFAERTICI